MVEGWFKVVWGGLWGLDHCSTLKVESRTEVRRDCLIPNLIVAEHMNYGFNVGLQNMIGDRCLIKQ